MNDLEKADLAAWLTSQLLGHGKKILAIKMIRFMFDANLFDAKKFVDRFEGGLALLKAHEDILRLATALRGTNVYHEAMVVKDGVDAIIELSGSAITKVKDT